MRTYAMRNRIGSIIVIGLLIVVIVIFLFSRIFQDSEKEAAEAVDQFYKYEREGNFSKSWSLFHTLMKERFSKGHYIQDRAHVFMNHFGVETFTYELGETEEAENWKISEGSTPFKKVYKVPVTQTFKGKYGNFDIHQEVYVVEEKDEWRILWDYKK